MNSVYSSTPNIAPLPPTAPMSLFLRGVPFPLARANGIKFVRDLVVDLTASIG